MPKLVPKIILEGTRLTFKTDIAFALNEHPRLVGPRKYKRVLPQTLFSELLSHGASLRQHAIIHR